MHRLYLREPFGLIHTRLLYCFNLDFLPLNLQAAADKVTECQRLLEAGIDPRVQADVSRFDCSFFLSFVLTPLKLHDIYTFVL